VGSDYEEKGDSRNEEPLCEFQIQWQMPALYHTGMTEMTGSSAEIVVARTHVERKALGLNLSFAGWDKQPELRAAVPRQISAVLDFTVCQCS
jgi:hypothetical protein